MTGKGDTPRPKSIPEAEFADNFARTFSRQPDARERLRRDNLAHAERIVLGSSCHDWPASDPIPTTDPED